MTDRQKDRRLHIGGVAIPLKAEHVADLYRTKIVYDCGSTDHDLHIDPDSRNWTLQGIERLCLAIVAAQAERANGEPPAGDNLAKAGAFHIAQASETRRWR